MLKSLINLGVRPADILIVSCLDLDFRQVYWSIITSDSHCKFEEKRDKYSIHQQSLLKGDRAGNENRLKKKKLNGLVNNMNRCGSSHKSLHVNFYCNNMQTALQWH